MRHRNLERKFLIPPVPVSRHSGTAQLPHPKSFPNRSLLLTITGNRERLNFAFGPIHTRKTFQKLFMLCRTNVSFERNLLHDFNTHPTTSKGIGVEKFTCSYCTFEIFMWQFSSGFACGESTGSEFCLRYYHP